MAPTKEFKLGNTTFSGCDITAIVGDKILSTLQGLSTSITREKAPIWVLGGVNYRSVSRGKRSIVGTLVFVLFDKHILLSDQGIAQNKDLRPYLDVEEIGTEWSAGNSDDLAFHWAAEVGVPVDEIDQDFDTGDIGANYQWSKASYTDQILPFDITAVAANEYGQRMKMAVGGVEILNDGSGFSIDDIASEEQCTYMARGIIPWTSLGNAS